MQFFKGEPSTWVSNGTNSAAALWQSAGLVKQHYISSLRSSSDINGFSAAIMRNEMDDEASKQHQDSKRNADSDDGSHPVAQKRRKKDLGRKGWRLFKPLPVA
jgi:hypothetical protein